MGAGIIQAKAAYDKISRQTAAITPLPPDELRNRSEGGNGPLVLNDPRSMLVKNLGRSVGRSERDRAGAGAKPTRLNPLTMEKDRDFFKQLKENPNVPSCISRLKQ